VSAPRLEFAAIELRHKIVNVENHTRPHKARNEGCKDFEVGHRVYVDDVVGFTPDDLIVKNHADREEGQQLYQVTERACFVDRAFLYHLKTRTPGLARREAVHHGTNANASTWSPRFTSASA